MVSLPGVRKMRKTTSCLPQIAEETFSPTERIAVLPHNARGSVAGVSTRRHTYSGRPSPPPASCGTKHPLPPEQKDNDTASVSFFHEFIPPTATAQTRRHTGRATYLPPATVRAQALLQAVMESHATPAPLAGPLRVSLLWTWPGKVLAPKTTRPDLDNLAKLALDAMTKACYWQDDSQVVELTTAKFVGPVAGLAVSVETIRCQPIDDATAAEVAGEAWA